MTKVSTAYSYTVFAVSLRSMKLKQTDQVDSSDQVLIVDTGACDWNSDALSMQAEA